MSGMWRFLSILLTLLALGSMAFGQVKPRPTVPFLILIEPQRAGPDVRPQDYIHEFWIHWPPSSGPGVGNALHSLVTGMDWRGMIQDYDFRANGDESWRAGNLLDLLFRGHFTAKRRTLGVPTVLVKSQRGSVTRNGMLLSVEADGIVQPLAFKRGLPPGVLAIGDASSWDDVADWVALTNGRVVVVEYPPPFGHSYSRLWLMGQAWPGGRVDARGIVGAQLPTVRSESWVPGLLPARVIGPLLVNRLEVAWRSEPGGSWPGANRWYETIEWVGKGVAVVSVLIGVAVLFSAIRLAGDERRSLPFEVATKAALLWPSSVLLAGAMMRFWGLGSAAIWQVLAFGLLIGVSLPVGLMVSRWLPRIHKLAGPFVTSFMVCLFVDPVYSAFSPVFRWITDSDYQSPISGASLGIFLASLTGSLTTLQFDLRLKWGLRLVPLALVGIGVYFSPWWCSTTHSHSEWLIPAAILAIALGQEGFLRPWMGLLLPPLSGVTGTALNHGISFRIDGLKLVASEALAVDAGPFLRFLISPLVLITFGVLVAGALTCNAFATHHFRRVAAQSLLTRNLGQLCGFMLVGGLFRAYLAEAGVIVGIACLTSLLFDAIHSV